MGEQITTGQAEAGSFRTHDGEVDFDDMGLRVKRVRLDATDLTDNSELDTGFDFPQSAIVEDVFLDVVTAEATATTKTLDVGLLSSETAGDADGFLAGADVSAAEKVRGTLASGGQTLGVLLSADEDGAGALVPEAHIISGSNAVSLSVTFGDAGGANELVVDVYVRYWATDDE